MMMICFSNSTSYVESYSMAGVAAAAEEAGGG